MKQFITTLVLLSATAISYSQPNLPYTANFNSGIPANWTQNTNQGVNWTSGSGLGTSGTNCAIADLTFTNPGGSGWLQTPFLNLTSVSNPILSFNVGVIKDGNTFYNAPYVSLWYAIGSGNWQFIESWGPLSSPPAATHIITQSVAFNPPPKAADITWVPVTKSLNAYSSQSNIRFSFGADIVASINNGWVVLDDVEFKSPTGIYDEQNDNSVVLFPNPSNGKFMLVIANRERRSGEQSQMEIYNVMGEKVYSSTQPLTNSTIDISNQPDGVYFLNIKTEKESYTKKIIIQQ